MFVPCAVTPETCNAPAVHGAPWTVNGNGLPAVGSLIVTCCRTDLPNEKPKWVQGKAPMLSCALAAKLAAPARGLPEKFPAPFPKESWSWIRSNRSETKGVFNAPALVPAKALPAPRLAWVGLVAVPVAPTPGNTSGDV